MIARLEGVLRQKAPTRLVVDVGGVGYDVWVSLSTFAALPDEGKTVALRIHTHVREDALQLYGFHSDLERTLFEQLIRISGVGPRLAQAVLSGIRPAELLGALRSEDLAALRAIPGVGVKTAQRILVELRDRVADLVAAGEEGARVPAAPAVGDERSEAVASALVNLGTARARAEEVARAVAEAHGPDDPLERLVRAALRRLAR